MSGKPPLLRLAVGVMAEASLLLQVEDEFPQLPCAYPSNVGAQVIALEKIVEVSDAAGDDCRGVGAFPFGCGAQLIAMQQAAYFGAGI